jgi:hypothetical protein
MSEQYLIWSNQHQQWWPPGRRGYTPHIEEAGRYDRATADNIVTDATCDGALSITRTDPYTGREYQQFSEVIVLAPECIDPVTRPDPGA